MSAAAEIKGVLSAAVGSATTQDVIAALAGKTQKFSSLFFTTTTATTIVLLSGSTALTGVMQTTANGQFRFTADDQINVASGEALRVTTGAACTLAGRYVGTSETP